MKNKCALILLILLSLGIIAATVACSPAVEIASIAISEKSGDFKTEYLVGEELNIDGIALTVTRTDGEVYDVYATDIRQDLRILNFSTEKPTDRLSVVLEYKGVSTSYDIVVKTVEAGTEDKGTSGAYRGKVRSPRARICLPNGGSCSVVWLRFC